MQKEIKKPVDILDNSGKLINSGWARDDIFNYDRSKINNNRMRIKEWDFWEVFNDKYRVILNIFDIGYAGVAQFSFLDFQTGNTTNAMLLKLFTRGSVGNPKSWRYKTPLIFKKGKNRMEFRRQGDHVVLNVSFPGKNIFGELYLYKDPDMDSMVNVIPFENSRNFVYAVKIMRMPAVGSIQLDYDKYEFSKDNNSWGILDWTRAVFPYRNHWKWCTASGKVGGVNFGFNIDYGFGTESNKSMIIYDRKGHHLDKAAYQHDWQDLNRPLEIKGDDGRVNLVLTPKHAEKTCTSLGFLEMKGVKTYGYFSGEMVLDDGSKVPVKESDKLFGWAEEFYQKW